MLKWSLVCDFISAQAEDGKDMAVNTDVVRQTGF